MRLHHPRLSQTVPDLFSALLHCPTFLKFFLNARKRLGGPQIYPREYPREYVGEYVPQRPGPKDGLQDAQDGSNIGMQREVLGPQSILCSFFRHADRIFLISRSPGTPKSKKNNSKAHVFLIFPNFCRKPRKISFWTGL